MEGPRKGFRHAVCNTHEVFKYKGNTLNSTILVLAHLDSALMLVVGQMTSLAYILMYAQSHILSSDKTTSLKTADHALSLFFWSLTICGGLV